jgi:hypothetical protein
MGESLAVTRGGSVAVLTVDRSGKRNAMTAGIWAALPGVLRPPADDPGVRALIVAGAGSRICAGAGISPAQRGCDILAAQAALVDRVVPADPRSPGARRRTSSPPFRRGPGEAAVEDPVARWSRMTIAPGELAEGVAAFADRRSPQFPWSR